MQEEKAQFNRADSVLDTGEFYGSEGEMMTQIDKAEVLYNLQLSQYQWQVKRLEMQEVSPQRDCELRQYKHALEFTIQNKEMLINNMRHAEAVANRHLALMALAELNDRNEGR